MQGMTKRTGTKRGQFQDRNRKLRRGARLPKEMFKKVLARLTEVVVLGKAHLKIGSGIAKTVTADPVIANVAPVFWGMSMTAHLDAAQMFAFKLFDPRRGSMTIEYLLDKAAECSGDFQNASPSQVSAIIDAACTQVSSLAAPLQPLRTKRNRILAHMDPTIVRDPEKLAKETQVTFSDLNLIFRTAGDIVNRISVAFRDISSDLELIGDTDYEGAVQLIVDAKHAQVDRYEEEFKQPAPFSRPKSPKSPW